jgi:hypothetical protein
VAAEATPLRRYSQGVMTSMIDCTVLPLSRLHFWTC